MKMPVIGIVSKHYKEGHPRDTMIHCSVKRAIFECGGTAIGILPACSDKVRSVDKAPEDRLTESEQADLIAQIRLCDGVLIQGGGYNDAYEVFVAKYCYDHDIPILGICAGFFNVIRAVGGKSKPLSDKVPHATGSPAGHKISVSGQLRQIMGCSRIWVNSRHEYQGILPDCLTLAAVAPDGVKEAAYAPEKRFYLAVQFHPEDLLERKPMRAIFQSFLRAAGESRV